MKEKIGRHFKGKRHLYYICLIIVAFVVLAGALNLDDLRVNLSNYFTGHLESESLGELNIYHQGTVDVVDQYFSEATNSVNNLAAQSSFIQDTTANNTASLTALLNQQRSINSLFDSWLVLNSKGIVIAVSSDDTSNLDQLGENEDTSPVFKTVSELDHPAFVPAHTGSTGNNFDIAAPIKNASGQLEGIVAGSITLKNLNTRLVLSSNFSQGLSTTLTDDKGNVLILSNKPVLKIENISGTEPLFKTLEETSTPPVSEEYNFAQQKVFVQGSNLHFGQDGNLILLSFYKVSTYQGSVNQLKNDIGNIFSTFIARDFLFLLIGLGLIGIVLSQYEKRLRK